MIHLGESAASVSADPAERALFEQRFRERHCVKLPGFLDQPLLHKLQAQLQTGTFVAKEHQGVGRELACWDSPAGDALLFLMNDPGLFRIVSDLTGIAPIGCFVGRVYRMTPAAAHHDSWHSDVGDHRLIALSVNLSEQPYRGGTLLLREQGRPETEQVLENTTPGDAVLFRIDPALEHAITDVEPGPPKTAWAGWFRSQPSFRDVLAGKTPF